MPLPVAESTKPWNHLAKQLTWAVIQV